MRGFDCCLQATVCRTYRCLIYYSLLCDIVDCNDGVRLRLWTATTNGHIVHLSDDVWVWRTTVEWYWQGKTEKIRRKTFPSATLSATNSAWIDTDANPGLHGERPATNRLSHGTALCDICDTVGNQLGTFPVLVWFGGLRPGLLFERRRWVWSQTERLTLSIQNTKYFSVMTTNHLKTRAEPTPKTPITLSMSYARCFTTDLPYIGGGGGIRGSILINILGPM
jgi:hypothetical protein